MKIILIMLLIMFFAVFILILVFFYSVGKIADREDRIQEMLGSSGEMYDQE